MTGNCERCRVAFTQKTGKGRFCSRDCWRTFEAESRPTTTCIQCGRQFRMKRYVLEAGFGKYCGRRCERASRPLRPLSDRLMSKVVKAEPGCWEWQGSRDRKGYGRISKGPGEHRPLLAHRVSYELHVGPIPDGCGVLHRCDNPRCVRPDHMFVGDQLVNMLDCSAKGRTTRGERSATAKLTEPQVREMKGRFAAGQGTYSSLARDYGVSRHTVSDILAGRRWPHLA